MEVPDQRLEKAAKETTIVISRGLAVSPMPGQSAMMQRRVSSRRARAFSSSRVETVLSAGSIRIGSAPAGPVKS